MNELTKNSFKKIILKLTTTKKEEKKIKAHRKKP